MLLRQYHDKPKGQDKPEKLTGAALEKALDEAGLSKDGTADEKRARLDESRLL